MAKVSKENFEYVNIPDYPIVVNDLRKTSGDMQDSINSTVEVAGLHNEKYELVSQAMDQIADIQLDMKQLLKMTPIKGVPHKHPGERRPSMEKPKTPEEEHEFLQRSRRAIENLQRNITELKSELKRKE